MLFITPFVIGIFFSIIGTLLPGILNGTIVRVYKEEGINKANHFAGGALVVIALQTYLAVFFAKLIYNSSQITFVLREIGLIVFLGLSVFFFLKKKSTNKDLEIDVPKQKNRFIHGIVLAVLNVFPIFFYVFITVTASSSKWYVIHPINNMALTLGVLLGTYLTFRMYLRLFRYKDMDTNFFLKNINPIIGTLTLIIAIFNLYKLLYES